MKKRFENKYFQWGLTAFLVIAGGILFYYLVFHSASLRANIKMVTGILTPILVGIGVAYLLTPVLNFIEDSLLFPLFQKCGMKDENRARKLIRGIGIIITALLFFLLVYALIAMLLSQIVPSIQNIVKNFDGYLDNFTIWLNEMLANNADIKDYVMDAVDKYSVELENWMNKVLLTQSSALIKVISLSVLSVVKGLWNFIIGFIISIYLLASKETLAGQAKKITYAVFEKNMANVLLNNVRFTHKTFIGFVGGKILDSIIIGLICLVCTSIMGTPYAALVSVIIGVTNVIPFFGPFIGAVPTAILILVVDPMHPLNCVYFIIFIFILQQFDGNILGPKILGSSTGISGFWVIFAITLFGGLMGVPGMIVGVPIFAVIYAMIKSFTNCALRKRELPESTAPYMKVGSVDEKGFHEYDPRKEKQAERQAGGKRKQGKEKQCGQACYGNSFYSNREDVRRDELGEGAECTEEVKEEVIPSGDKEASTDKNIKK